MFENMKVGIRLGLGFGVIFVFMIAVILFGLTTTKKVFFGIERIVEVENVSTFLANEMIDDIREYSINIRGVLLDRVKKNQEEKLKLIDGLWKHYYECLDKYEKSITKEETKAFDIVSQIKVVQDDSKRLYNSLINMVQADKYSEAIDLENKELRLINRQWINHLDELIRLEREVTALNFENAKKQYASSFLVMILLGSVTLVLGILIAVLLTMSITKPLKLVTDMITSKDLTMDFSAYKTSRSEFGVMIQSFSEMVAMIRNQMKEILEGVNLLTTTSSEILVSTTQVATGAAENVVAINETTTTVEEVKQAAQLSSQKAKGVSESSQKLANVSQTGQKSVEETTAEINRIRVQMESIAKTIVSLSEQSQSIGGIIASVTDIADQSNLLAVNAGIEAARAGEQGKGFAVVAQEIRSLAEQSKQATTEVRRILNDVQKSTNVAVMVTEQGSKAVESGVKQAMQAGEVIKALTDATQEAVQAAMQIVASSNQQVVGMDQIGKAMESINQSASENATSIKQTETAAKNINELGQKLKQMVSQYKI
ncbi:MAG: methyl-accepting chemotaxis protein [Elusimicrobiota bacterium]